MSPSPGLVPIVSPSWDRTERLWKAMLYCVSGRKGSGSGKFYSRPIRRGIGPPGWLPRVWAPEPGASRMCVGSDLIVVVGADPLTEAPVSALAMRQAVLGGAHAAVIDPRPVELPFEAEHLTIGPERLGAVLKGLADGDFSTFESADRHALEGLRGRLEKATQSHSCGWGGLPGLRRG